MTRTGSETRQKTKVVGIRMDAPSNALLHDRAARAGMGHCEYARGILEHHLTGAEAVQSVARNRLVVADSDRAMLGEFSRNAGRLAGALIQAAKGARQAGNMASYHTALEQLLADIKIVKQAVDAIQKDIS